MLRLHTFGSRTAALTFALFLAVQAAPLNAQTIPPVPTPEAPVPTTAPPPPDLETLITPDAPLVLPIDPAVGATLSVTSGGESPTVLSLAATPETFQNLTDINGNPVQAGRLEVRPSGQDAAAALAELPAAALADSGTLERRIGDVIRIQLFDVNGNLIQRPNFNPPVTLCFTPTAEQIAQVGAIDAVTITTFDSLIGAWTALGTTVIGGQVCASITHLSFFILTVREPVAAVSAVQPAAAAALPIPARLPNTDGAGMMNGWLSVVLVLAALSLGWWLRRSVG